MPGKKEFIYVDIISFVMESSSCESRSNDSCYLSFLVWKIHSDETCYLFCPCGMDIVPSVKQCKSLSLERLEVHSTILLSRNAQSSVFYCHNTRFVFTRGDHIHILFEDIPCFKKTSSRNKCPENINTLQISNQPFNVLTV